MSDFERLSRRQFFRGIGLAALTGLPACAAAPSGDPFRIEKPPVPGAEKWRRYQERRIATACGQCAAGCGVAVRVVEGRGVRIDGEPDNPVNRGGIGPRGRSGLEVLYDPDRVRQPLRRKGARGAHSLAPVSWSDALGELGRRLAELRARGEPHRLAIVCGRARGTVRDLWERFALAYGTPNHFDGLSRADGPVAQAMDLLQGVHEIPAYDWGSTRYVLSLGAGVLEASCQAIYFARAAARMRRGRPTERGKIVHVEPSRSRTAANADEWISILPGTYAAFALGIAHVLVRDGAYDREFLEERCFGFEDWSDEQGRRHRGLRSLLLSTYAPGQAGALCGVPATTIERIAREIAAERPALAITDPRATRASNGLQVAMATHALNVLLGSIDRPGGVLVQRSAPIAEWPAVVLDDAARAGSREARLDGAGGRRYPIGRSALEALPDALLSGSPYAADLLLLDYANPLYSGTNPQRWRRALDKVPFIVTFTPFLDETAAEVADLVLPDHTYLERFEDAAPAPSVGFAVFGVRQPVVEPLYDTRHTGEAILDIARGLGGPVAAAFPWKDFRTLLVQRITSLQKSQRGSIREDSSAKFLRELFQRGFWEEPPYEYGHWSEVIRTPSGRVELFSRRLWEALHDLAERSGKSPQDLLREWGFVPDLDVACLPHHDPIRWQGAQEDYPLVLDPYTPGTYAVGSGANLPLLQELVTEPGLSAWKTTAEIHPETAAAFGVRAGDTVEVQSLEGRLTLPVHLDAGVHPEAVRIAQGGGHTAFGRFARGHGANVMDLVAPSLDPLGGTPSYLGTRVRIRRVAT